MINLIVQFYQIKYENVSEELIKKRQEEINYCFYENYLNENIDKIHFLYENLEDVVYMEKKLNISRNDNKIILFNLGKRINYQDIFKYSRNYNKNNIWVYLHADMKVEQGFELIDKNLGENNVFSLTAHKKTCNNKLKCDCTRQYSTPYGIFSPTFDGFIFRGWIKENVIKRCNHIVHCLGAENRTIAILKQEGHMVYCPNNSIKCRHVHDVKIFAKEHQKWINLEGRFKPQEYYSKKHREQKNKDYSDKIIGGGIPFYLGTVQFIEFDKNQ
jgi:hypothetical protein